MNIWLINHYAVPPKYYPLARPTNFAKHLMRMGHQVTIFAASTVHNSDLNLIRDHKPYREEIVDGVHYVYVCCRDYRGSGLIRIYNMCEFAARLPSICARYSRPDAIVATSMPPMSCAMGIRLAKRYGCKAIAEIADLWPESIVAYGIAGEKNLAVIALRWLEKWIYTQADDIVFTMEGAYDYIVEQGWENDIPKEKVHFINNGVDLAQFDDNRDRYVLEDPDLDDRSLFKVVYTGSIRKVNNLGLLLDAAKCVKNKKVVFLIWGDGDELPALKKRVEVEKIDSVVFKGRVEKKYVPSITSRADLNIAHNTPSPLFRFGISFNKLFDYLAAGRPILCDFPCPYNPAVLYRAGIDVKVPNAQNVAAAIDQMSVMDENTRRRYCENARKCAKNYDFTVLTEKLANLLEV